MCWFITRGLQRNTWWKLKMDWSLPWPPTISALSCSRTCWLVSNYWRFSLRLHLVKLYADLLKRSAPSRIVVVASSLYQLACLNLDNLNPSSSWFPPYIYYPSKYANICFTLELARRLEGTGVTANCLHPGLIDSGIWRNVPVPLNWPLKLIVKGFFKTPQQGKTRNVPKEKDWRHASFKVFLTSSISGCQTTLYLACSDEVKNVSGKYFMECREHSLNRGASDMTKAGKLWELSKELTKLKPTDPAI